MINVTEVLIEKIHHLDEPTQLRLLELVESMEMTSPRFQFQEWFAQLEQLGDLLEAKYGRNFASSVQISLDEAREERLDDLMDRC